MKAGTQIPNEVLQNFVYHQTRKGVSHANLTRPAFDLLKERLEGFGNKLSDLHCMVLYELCGTLTKFARGDMTGRRVFALNTGLGKTSAIIAWITALHRLGPAAKKVAVSVSASKVEALCRIKRQLIERGVPEQDIGLKHSVADASEPSTGDADRRFMLVTHQRVKGGIDRGLFLRHKGNPRSVMVYDESMFRSHSAALSERKLRGELEHLRQDVRDSSDFIGMVQYLDDSNARIAEALGMAKTEPSKPRLVHLPMLGGIEQSGYLTLLQGRSFDTSTLQALIGASGDTVRAAVTQQGEGVLWHELAIPHELSNVLVLDASYPIRALCQLDPTLQAGSQYSDAEVKRFDDVTIHQMFAYGGRNSIERSFREQSAEKRTVSREVISVVQGIPIEEDVLIFTFKDRATKIRARLLGDLEAAGVSLRRGDKERVHILSWGDETSLNDYAHCQNVILAGVLRRSHLDLASVVLGQLGNSQADLHQHTLADLEESEIAHCIFQALSRGRCREVVDGQAKPVKAWLIHPTKGIRERLAPVMPGAKWAGWEPVCAPAGEHKVQLWALRILEHLKALPDNLAKVPTKSIRGALGIPDDDGRMFRRAIEAVLEDTDEWIRSGQSLARNNPFLA